MPWEKTPWYFMSEGAADIAPAAVAADQIVGFDGFFVCRFSCRGLSATTLSAICSKDLNSVSSEFQPAARSRHGGADRIEVGLGNPQPAFGTIRRTRLGRAVGRMIEAGDLEAVHARDEQIIARVVGRIARLETHAVGEAPAAQVLAGARVGEIGGRKIHRSRRSARRPGSECHGRQARWQAPNRPARRRR